MRGTTSVAPGWSSSSDGPGQALRQAGAILPVAPHGRRDPHPDRRLRPWSSDQRIAARRLWSSCVEQVEPALRLVAEQMRPGQLGDREVRQRVAALAVDPFPGVGQALEGVLADQHVAAEARLTVLGRGHPDEALVGQRFEPVDHADGQRPVGIDDRLGGLARPPAVEHGQAPEDRPVRPRSSRSWLQATVPRRVRWRSGRSRAPPLEQVEARSEALEDRGRAHEPRPGGGQFDRQRESLEAGPRCRATTGRSRSSRSAPARRARARSRNSSTPSAPASGGTAYSCSPATRRISRLVTIRRSPGDSRSSVATIVAAAGAGAARGCRGRGARRRGAGARAGSWPPGRPAPRAARGSWR